MDVYRLSKRCFASPLSGKGAALFGGRWNSKGTEIIYTSQSRALSLLEFYVHVSPAFAPRDLVMVTVHIPDNLQIITYPADHLPHNWQNYPCPPENKTVGDHFISDNSACLLEIPSALIPEEHNILINPFHPDFSKITLSQICDFSLDDRLSIRD